MKLAYLYNMEHDEEHNEDLTLNHFAGLPNELKFRVFSYLPFKDILNARLVCQDWSNCTYPKGTLLKIRKIVISGDDGTNTAQLVVRDHGMKKVSLGCLCDVGDNLVATTEELELEPSFRGNLKRFLKLCTNLRSICVEFEMYEDLSALISNNAKTLEKISLAVDDSFEFDCKMLTQCTALLLFNVYTDFVDFKNHEHLPRQISSLTLGRLEDNAIISWIGENLKGLKSLTFGVYHSHEADEEFESSEALSRDDLKKLLEMPELEKLEVEFFSDSNSGQCLEAEGCADFCNAIEGVAATSHGCYLSATIKHTNQ